jgi:hypothetical protein
VERAGGVPLGGTPLDNPLVSAKSYQTNFHSFAKNFYPILPFF